MYFLTVVMVDACLFRLVEYITDLLCRLIIVFVDDFVNASNGIMSCLLCSATACTYLLLVVLTNVVVDTMFS